MNSTPDEWNTKGLQLDKKNMQLNKKNVAHERAVYARTLKVLYDLENF